MPCSTERRAACLLSAVAFWAVRRSERRLAVTRRRVTGQDERINP
ncbi:hypothetical protein [Nonomuraea dietziae]|uniref:Uncharacterized protein n=1 Tax=Nonomuraea dietziae TaxID=65515 RepID=A0A7W5VDT1_9ACTN|nr:hypothetical protein [Nonomuraea dietziae]MBB3731810.1 hypothetical protein [Nonomuraea dietziae]